MTLMFRFWNLAQIDSFEIFRFKKFEIFKFFVATRNVNFDVENDIEQGEPKIID